MRKHKLVTPIGKKSVYTVEMHDLFNSTYVTIKDWNDIEVYAKSVPREADAKKEFDAITDWSIPRYLPKQYLDAHSL